jgi:hypothetical protein
MTISTEQLKDQIAILQETAVPGESDYFNLAVLRELLASREAKPYGYLRENDGQIQIFTGHDRPHDRSGGYSTSWSAIYAAPPAPTVSEDVLTVMEEVIRRSDRDHEAWNRAKAAISDCRATALQSFGNSEQLKSEVMICDMCGHDAWLEENGWLKCDQGHSFLARSEHVSTHRLPNDHVEDRLDMAANKQTAELVMWIKRLVQSLKNAKPDSKLHHDAMDYLSRNGLIGVMDCLRNSNSPVIPDDWIPCSERMPVEQNENGRYMNVKALVTDGWAVLISSCTTERLSNGKLNQYWGCFETNVTHWMPLPLGPLEKGKSK